MTENREVGGEDRESCDIQWPMAFVVLCLGILLSNFGSMLLDLSFLKNYDVICFWRILRKLQF